MDPLSVTASVVTLLAAGGTLVQGLEKLCSLREAPDIILALNSEISDFRLVIIELASALQYDPTRTLSNAQLFSADIPPILDRARDKLLELECLIQYRLILPRTDGSIRLNKAAWFWERQKVKRLQEEIRSIRTNLVAAISVFISKSAIRLELQMSGLRSSSDCSHGEMSRSLATATAMSSNTEGLLVQLLHTVAQNQARIESRLHDGFTASAAQVARLSGPPRGLDSFPQEYESIDREVSGDRNYLVSCTLQGRNYHCAPCSCSCHRRSSWASPKWMSPFLGRLFAGYAAFSILTRSCNEITCQRKAQPSMSIRYYFPSWFAQRVLQVRLQFCHPGSIEQSLRISRIVWIGSELFIKSHSGDVDGVKALLVSRESSPYDATSTYKESALGIAAAQGHVDVCRILIQEGADVLHCDVKGRTVIYLAWTLVLGKYYDAHTSESMQSIMPARNIDEYAFSNLHQAVLGLKSVTVGEALQQSPQWKIDEEDSSGRTALSWAAQRDDAESMAVLLHHKADPHKADHQQRTPISWALKNGSARCGRLLLEQGMNVDALDAWGVSPLLNLCSNLRSFAKNLELLNLLLQYHPNIDYQSPEGDTALLVALENQNNQMATRLIHCGADIHITENSGYNALSVAVLFNTHSVIRLLLDRKADHHGTIIQHGSLLHLVAQTADIETLRMLTNPGSDLATRDVQTKRGDGKTAFAVAESRPDSTLEWQNAFWAFIWSVDATKTRVSPFETASPGRVGDDDADDSGSEGDVFVDAVE